MAQTSLPKQLTQRTPLQEIIPLETPFSVLVSPMDYCNIKCVFCPFHGVVTGDNRDPGIMPLEMFQKIVDQLSKFPGRLRAFVFCGRGEPTLHRELPKMIAYAKKMDIADEIRLTTNGFLLEPSLNEALIESGLDYIRISVPAIDDETCFRLTGAKLDLEAYISNIRNLYEHKHPNMTVFCKTTNVAMGGGNGRDEDSKQRETFYSKFQDCCDYCFVETVVSQVPKKLSEKEQLEVGIYGSKENNVYHVCNDYSPVCERMFYHMTINSNGDVFPCDLNENAGLHLGNVREKNLYDIWNSDRFNQLRLSFLQGAVPESCKECGVFSFDFSNDLHKHSDEIIKRIIHNRL